MLLIDWDLEAPGLYRYLRPFLVDPELKSSPGVIDFVWDAARVNVTPADKSQAGVARRSLPVAEFPSLEDYVVGLDWDFHDNGSISFIPAGRQDENYAQRVNTFSWDNFYERLGGGKLLQAEIEALRKSYDYILIDSRTGVSDTSGICTVQMPDVLVVCFTLNWQSIKGAAAVASSVRAQRGASFPIYPVPTRIENGEQGKLKSAIAYARRTFAPFLLHVQSERSKVVLHEQAGYWHEVETPYISYYAFEEVPAAFMEETGSLRGVLAPTERLAARLSDQRVTALKPETEQSVSASSRPTSLRRTRSRRGRSHGTPRPRRAPSSAARLPTSPGSSSTGHGNGRQSRWAWWPPASRSSGLAMRAACRYSRRVWASPFASEPNGANPGGFPRSQSVTENERRGFRASVCKGEGN